MTCTNCREGWVCETHPHQPWPDDHIDPVTGRDCGGAGSPCLEPGCELSMAAMSPYPVGAVVVYCKNGHQFYAVKNGPFWPVRCLDCRTEAAPETWWAQNPNGTTTITV